MSSRRPRAFSLLELTAVGVVLLTLMGISVVGFRAVEKRTVANRAKTELTQLASSLQGYYNARGYYPTDAPTLKIIEPNLRATTATLTERGVVSLMTTNVSGVDVLGLAILDESGQCVMLRVTPDRSPSRASSTGGAPSSCSGTAATAITGVEW